MLVDGANTVRISETTVLAGAGVSAVPSIAGGCQIREGIVETFGLRIYAVAERRSVFS